MTGEQANPHDINEMNQLSTWEIAGAPFAKLIGKPLKECSRAEIASVRHRVQANLADNANGLAFVKTHHALVMDRGQPTINFDVTSGAIYLVRNPLDVAISFSHHMNASIDEAIDQMSRSGLETPIGENSVYEVYGSWSENVASWTGKPHRTVLVMKYEDMLEQPRATFAKLAQHLLLEPTKEQLDEAVLQSSFKKLQAQELEKGFSEKPKNSGKFFRAGKSGQWKEALSQNQIDRIRSNHGEQMARFGYL